MYESLRNYYLGINFFIDNNILSFGINRNNVYLKRKKIQAMNSAPKKPSFLFFFILLLIAGKTNAQWGGRWYSYTDYSYNQDVAAGGSGASFGLTIWNDTTAYADYGSGASAVQFNSVGTSFSPRMAAWNNSSVYGGTIKIGPTDAFMIDSIRILGLYRRNPAKPLVKDTVKLSIVYGDATPASNLPVYSLSSVPYYGSVSFVDMLYDSVNNTAKRASGLTPAVYTQNVVLSLADAADTDAYGTMIKSIGLSTPVSVPAGNLASISLAFKSGDASYAPHDTLFTSATYTTPKFDYFAPLVMYKLDAPGGTVDWAIYDPLDSNVGYFEEYRGMRTGSWGHNYVPTWAWTSGGSGPAYIQYPIIDFHVFCATCRLEDTVSGTSLSICSGTTTSLSYTTSGGAWTSSSTSVATVGASSGTVYGVSAGVTTITYTLGGHIATTTVTVITSPAAGTISGPSSVCTGSTITLSDVGGGSGTWTSSTPSVATIGGSGIVSGVSPGTTTISYTVSTACGTARATMVVSVNPSPSAGTITGASTVCVSGTTALTDPATGGAWSSFSTSIATVNSTGVVTGVTPGVTTISYSLTTVCGFVYAAHVMTVTAGPSAGTISGPATVCTGGTITLTDGAAGGTWSASPGGIATVTGTGVVGGATTGTATISYTVSGACGSVVATYTIVVNPGPSAGSISGPSTVCAGSTVNLTDATAGGVWTASNANAFISSTGAALGVAAGADTIVYTVSNSCGSGVANWVITILGLPDAGVIAGPDTVCIGTPTTMADTASGGAWATATGNAFISSSGGIVGITAGTDTVEYTVSNTCGSTTAQKLVIVSSCISGVQNVSNNDIVKIYPNPAQSEVTIEANETIGSVVITDRIGRNVFTGNYSARRITIDVASLPAGIYLLKVNDSKVYKLTKE